MRQTRAATRLSHLSIFRRCQFALRIFIERPPPQLLMLKALNASRCILIQLFGFRVSISSLFHFSHQARPANSLLLRHPTRSPTSSCRRRLYSQHDSSPSIKHIRRISPTISSLQPCWMMESLPLGEKSPNIRETDVASRKRSHDEFASEDVVHLGPDQEPKRPLNTSIHPADASREYNTRVLQFVRTG